MKSNKMPLFKIAAVFLYLLFFLLIQELFTNLENSPYTMMSLDENFYRLLGLKLALTKFFQWFLLGVLLAFINLYAGGACPLLNLTYLLLKLHQYVLPENSFIWIKILQRRHL